MSNAYPFVAAGQPGGVLRIAEPLLARVLRHQFNRYGRLKGVLEEGRSS